MNRGEIWWGDPGDPKGSTPGFKRPLLIVQSDAFNRSRIRSVMVIPLTSNLARGPAPGNVVLTRKESGLPRDSVALVNQVMSLDRNELVERVSRLRPAKMSEIDRGLRLSLAL